MLAVPVSRQKPNCVKVRNVRLLTVIAYSCMSLARVV